MISWTSYIVQKTYYMYFPFFDRDNVYDVLFYDNISIHILHILLSYGRNFMYL